MPVFEYRALNTKGAILKGVMEADSERHVRAQLREKKLILDSLKQVKKNNSSQNSLRLFQPKLKTKDKIIVTRQLANLIRASLPVEEALRTIAEHNNSSIKRTLSSTRSRVIEGSSLHEALLEQNIFDQEYTSTIAAGEKTGELATVLEKLADDVERKEKFNRNISSAMIYPALILIVSVAVVIALLAFVVPEVVSAFANTKRELPALTQAMIAISDFLRNNGMLLFSSIVVFFTVFNLSLRNVNVKRHWHRFLMKLPLIGKIFVGSNSSQFSRNLSLMQSSGVPVIESLRSTASTLSCIPMSEAIQSAANDIREGSSIYRSLEKHKALPPMILYMLASGEASGNMPDMLQRAAINQEHEIESFTTSLLSIIGPVIILLMGGFVLIIILSILLPIFELNNVT